MILIVKNIQFIDFFNILIITLGNVLNINYFYLFVPFKNLKN